MTTNNTHRTELVEMADEIAKHLIEGEDNRNQRMLQLVTFGRLTFGPTQLTDQVRASLERMIAGEQDDTYEGIREAVGEGMLEQAIPEWLRENQVRDLRTRIDRMRQGTQAPRRLHKHANPFTGFQRRLNF